MISKSDCILLLSEISESGIDTSQILKDLVKSKEPTIEVIKFINDNRPLDLSRFYTKIRKSYNQKHSNLYINIVKEIEDVNSVLTTLSALETQILLFAQEAEDRTMFLKHARASEISKVLTHYFQTYDITNCLRLMRVIKADIKALESVR